MNWIINPVVTVNGTDYTADTLNGVSITYGRSDIWEQARAGFATIQILNDDNSIFAGELNDTVTVQVDDSNGNPVTIFTGQLNTISNSVQYAGSSATVVIHQITAIGPFAQMSRALTHTSAFPKEYDDDRLTRIITDSGVSIETIDTPGVYEFTATSANPNDCYYWAAYYANMAFGYIYETPLGEVGYANESRRTIEAQTSGYYVIPENIILFRSVNSSIDLNNVLNDVRLEYKNNQIVTSTSSSSITSYGTRAANILTELEDTTQAQNQADRYIALRSTPQSVLRSFTIQLSSPDIVSADLNALLGVYMGKPVQVTDFPNGIVNGIFQGFVEGWTFRIDRFAATLNLNVTRKSLSLAPTRWQDVAPTLQWEDVDPTLEWADYE